MRWKKEPEISDGDINGFTDWGTYTSEARSWSDTEQQRADKADMVADVSFRWREAVTYYRGN